jgi:hypothetical protein
LYFWGISKYYLPKIHPKQWTTYRENLLVNRSQIWLGGADLNSGCLSRAGITIYFSQFWGKFNLPILKNGGIPEKLKVGYFENGSMQIYETWWISTHYRYPHSVFFRDFSERGQGNSVAPNFFSTNLTNVGENGKILIYDDET